MMELQERIKSLSASLFESLQTIRRQLHQHPELSFEEVNTSKYIQEQLKSAGISFTAGHVKTGIIASIQGKNPTKKTLLIRADMDALPIEEKNNVAYKSKNRGVMHACGHDVHSTVALGAAFVLNELKHEFEGTVKIMFQPGEEVLPGGAQLMIKAGALENPKVDRALALHVYPEMEAGSVGFRQGMYMASTDELYITVHGKGGHAAMPERYTNPLIAASAILLEIQNTFMQKDALNGTMGETTPTVLAFGKIEARGATNVIPDNVDMAGTFRTMNEQWRKEVHQKLKIVVEKKAEEYQCTADLRIEHGYPFLVNDTAFTLQCMAAAKEFLGSTQVEELPLRMTAEDFAFISQAVPSCFFRLGTGNSKKGITAGVHTANFDIDESALQTGCGVMAWLAIQELNS
jgi:amidohydrolase